MELSRKEVVEIYNNLKDVNLSGMSKECKEALVVNAIKLQPVAEQITEEDTKVVEKYKTEEYTKALEAYILAKTKFEKELPQASKEVTEGFEKAAKAFRPLFEELDKEVENAVAKLQQSFDIELLKIPMMDYLEVLDKTGKEFSYSSLTPIKKLLE